MSRGYKSWSTAELKRAIEMRKKGKTSKEIGEELGRDAEPVRTKLYMSGNPKFKAKYWSKEEWEYAQQLRDTGMFYKDIGEILDRDYHSVANKFHIERNKLKKRSVVNE